MSDDHTSIDVSILDKVFSIRCPMAQREKLLESAAYLDQKMREIRDASQLMSHERIAVLAALNNTYELLFQERNTPDVPALNIMIEDISKKLHASLSTEE